MAFVSTTSEAQAEGEVAELYAENREAWGYVPDFAKVLCLRPAVFRAWGQLIGEIRGTMDRRRFELATLAAARQLRSSYCSLAHAKVLRDRFLSVEQLVAVAVDHHHAGLDELDVAVMDLAAQVAADATQVTAANVERLRALGLSDPEIADVVLAAAARSFFTKALDGLGAEPDPAFRELEPELQEVLVVGRPIATG